MTRKTWKECSKCENAIACNSWKHFGFNYNLDLQYAFELMLSVSRIHSTNIQDGKYCKLILFFEASKNQVRAIVSALIISCQRHNKNVWNLQSKKKEKKLFDFSRNSYFFWNCNKQKSILLTFAYVFDSDVVYTKMNKYFVVNK